MTSLSCSRSVVATTTSGRWRPTKWTVHHQDPTPFEAMRCPFALTSASDRLGGGYLFYHVPVLGTDFHGSSIGSGSPACKSSIEMPLGLLIKAMRPSRGGRLMTTPACLCWPVVCEFQDRRYRATRAHLFLTWRRADIIARRSQKYVGEFPFLVIVSIYLLKPELANIKIECLLQIPHPNHRVQIAHCIIRLRFSSTRLSAYALLPEKTSPLSYSL